MITACAMIAGALTSAAWIAPKPYCYVYAIVASAFFVIVRQSQ